jgi:hypothetical protein
MQTKAPLLTIKLVICTPPCDLKIDFRRLHIHTAKDTPKDAKDQDQAEVPNATW